MGDVDGPRLMVSLGEVLGVNDVGRLLGASLTLIDGDWEGNAEAAENVGLLLGDGVGLVDSVGVIEGRKVGG
jgi:hypothetical protein